MDSSQAQEPGQKKKSKVFLFKSERKKKTNHVEVSQALWQFAQRDCGISVDIFVAQNQNGPGQPGLAAPALSRVWTKCSPGLLPTSALQLFCEPKSHLNSTPKLPLFLSPEGLV